MLINLQVKQIMMSQPASANYLIPSKNRNRKNICDFHREKRTMALIKSQQDNKQPSMMFTRSRRKPDSTDGKSTMTTSASSLSPTRILSMLCSVIMIQVVSQATATPSPYQQQLNSHLFSPDHNATTTTSNKPYSTNNVNYESQILATFSTPNQAINISHVTYDPLYDTIYLGASNALYQLNGSDLSEQFDQITGPVQDHPSCGITECNGYEDFMKPTTNVNKLLVIDYQHQKLIACFSTKQGACRRYQLNNISQKEDLISMAVAANDDNSSTYAFIAPARYDYDASTSMSTTSSSGNINQQEQQVLYVATTYTKVGQSRDLLVPAIGTRKLDDGPNLLKLYENSFLDSARIDINSHLRDYFLVNYLYGFSSSDYVYFITLQRKATSRDYEELGYHTRIARICITDSSYNSYTEVDLKCVAPPAKPQTPRGEQQQEHESPRSPSEYPLLQDAILVDAGSQLLQSLGQHASSQPQDHFSANLNSFISSSPDSSESQSSPDDNKVLLGVFSSARDHTQHPGDHSALCAFSLAQIEEKFSQNIHNCYTGKTSSRNMEYIAGNVQECPRSGQGGNVVNFCHETLKINATLPIVSEPAIQFANTTLTAVTATSRINSNLKNIYSGQLASELTASNNNSSNSLLFKRQEHATFKNQQQFNMQTVAFLGTSNGFIKKILLNNGSAGHEFEQVQLDSSAPILSDLHIHSSGRSLIAATPYKVFKVSLDNCGQYGNCRECSQSRNPYCGWCSLKRSCTTKPECSPASESQSLSDQLKMPTPATTALFLQQQQQQQHQQQQQQHQQNLKWISSLESSGKCIDLQAIVPDKIPITSTGKIDLHIDKLPRLPNGQFYRCIFDRREQTTATPTRFGLTCPLPKVSQRPKIEPGRDHASVELALRSSETNTDFLNGKITFFECQLHTTCKDCLTTNWGCNWCLNENICLFNTSKCERGHNGGSLRHSPTIINTNDAILQAANNDVADGRRALIHSGGGAFVRSAATPAVAGAGSTNTIGLVGQCPTFDLRDKQEILIPDGSEQRELSIRVKNMPQVKGPIQCLVEIESSKIELKARIEHDRVICDNSSYSYAAEVGLLQAQLVVLYSDNNIIIDRTNFTLYKCHLLGAHLGRADCSLCKRIETPFQCAWCSGSCKHRSRCLHVEQQQCPAPRIDSVWPLSGPIYGGTRLTIEGSNLGQSFEEIENRVRLGANSTCRPLESEYRVSNRIVCLTSAISSQLTDNANSMGQPAAGYSSKQPQWAVDIQVGNRAGYAIAPSKFTFKPIYLRDHQPRYGPQSGGTRITLTGTNLNVGSSVQVFLDELPCLVEPSSVTSEQLTCRTGPSKHSSRLIRQLKLVIDDAQIIRDGSVFLYTQDPTISRLSPLKSYLSGGRPINVFGTNLTSIQAPRMVLYDPVSLRKINESLCLLHDDPNRMQCPSPTVSLAQLDSMHVEQSGGAGSEYSAQQMVSLGPIPDQAASASFNAAAAAQEDSLLKFRVGFIMDDVFTQAKQNLLVNSELLYTTDPRLYPFASADYKAAQEASSLSLVGAGDPMHMSNTQQRLYQMDADTYLIPPAEPVLILHGEHLRTAVSDYEITVTIGQDLCNFTQLTQTKLICSVQLDRVPSATDEEGRPTARSLPLVVVRIGFNLRFELGYVQFHPDLVEQIFRNSVAQLNANGAPPALSSSSSSSNSKLGVGANNNQHHQHQLITMMQPPQNYVPSERENFLHKVAWYALNFVLAVVLLSLCALMLFLFYTGVLYSIKLKEESKIQSQYKRIVSRIESIEKSVKGECRLASMTLQSELNELVGHIELSGSPAHSAEKFLQKLLSDQLSASRVGVVATSSSTANSGADSAASCYLVDSRQEPIVSPLVASPLESQLEKFQQLLFQRPFLVTFVGALDRAPSLSLRDKLQVGNLLTLCLMQKPDYMADVLRTLVLQHLSQNYKRQDEENCLAFKSSGTSNTTNKFNVSNYRKNTSNSSACKTLLGGANLSKVVSGSASSLMASTQVAAQMLLGSSRAKQATTLNWQTANQQHQQQIYNNNQNHHHTINLHGHKLMGGGEQARNHCVSTTTFNDHNQHQTLDPRSLLQLSSRSSSSNNYAICRGGATSSGILTASGQDSSVTERMLSNWVALSMFEYLQHGPMGRSLYLLFEALKRQLDRGPVDTITGDAYYSLDSGKLLREPNIQFEAVNLYLIVEADLLQPVQQVKLSSSIYDQPIVTVPARVAVQQNTITLTVRVLDCDTISQVKAKALDAVYRNSPASSRLKPQHVELLLRHQQQQQQEMNASQQAQYSNLLLEDEDQSSLVAINGKRRVNTLRHYGVCEQAIMMLNRRREPPNLGDILCSPPTQTMGDTFNPYSEILYGPLTTPTTATASSTSNPNNSSKLCHLMTNSNQQQARLQMQTRRGFETSPNCLYLHSEESSPNSHSPSMMLLCGAAGNESACATTRVGSNQSHQHQQYQQYHPSTSSSSSNGTHAQLDHLSSVSSPITNHLLLQQQQQQQQPIYCQIGSQNSARNESSYYCQINPQQQQRPRCANNTASIYSGIATMTQRHGNQQQLHPTSCDKATTSSSGNINEIEQNVYLSRMLASKGTVQTYIENLFKTILNGPVCSVQRAEEQQNEQHQQQFSSINQYRQRLGHESKFLCADVTAGTTRRRQLAPDYQLTGNGSALVFCPPVVKWLFDLLDEAAMENGVTNSSIVDGWKSNTYLVRFWANLIKNPQLVLDVDKSSTLDANLNVISQLLVDSCVSSSASTHQASSSPSISRMIFANDIPKYANLIRSFYQDIGSMKPIGDHELATTTVVGNDNNTNKSATMGVPADELSQAVKQLCGYAMANEAHLMRSLNESFVCQQLIIPNKLRDCFRTLAYYESF